MRPLVELVELVEMAEAIEIIEIVETPSRWALTPLGAQLSENRSEGRRAGARWSTEESFAIDGAEPSAESREPDVD
jgi:hypothetical protein